MLLKSNVRTEHTQPAEVPGDWGGPPEQKEAREGCQLGSETVRLMFLSVCPGWSVDIRPQN